MHNPLSSVLFFAFIKLILLLVIVEQIKITVDGAINYLISIYYKVRLESVPDKGKVRYER